MGKGRAERVKADVFGATRSGRLREPGPNDNRRRHDARALSRENAWKERRSGS